jgi:hypothetical protein
MSSSNTHAVDEAEHSEMFTDESAFESSVEEYGHDVYEDDVDLTLGFPSPHGVSSEPMAAEEDIDAACCMDIDTVFRMMRRTEGDGAHFADARKYFKHRRVLVDWICEMGDKFGLNASTAHVAVAYLDRIVSGMSLESKHLQIVALACFVIAAKYEEAEENVPRLSHLIHASGTRVRPQQVHHMEVLVLSKLNWKLTANVPRHFLDLWSKRGVVFSTDTMDGRPLIPKVARYMVKYMNFFSDLTLQSHDFCSYKPSVLAAAIVVASRRALNVMPIWNSALAETLVYSLPDITPCLTHVWTYYHKAFPVEAAQADEKVEASHARIADALARRGHEEDDGDHVMDGVSGTAAGGGGDRRGVHLGDVALVMKAAGDVDEDVTPADVADLKP